MTVQEFLEKPVIWSKQKQDHKLSLQSVRYNNCIASAKSNDWYYIVSLVNTHVNSSHTSILNVEHQRFEICLIFLFTTCTDSWFIFRGISVSESFFFLRLLNVVQHMYDISIATNRNSPRHVADRAISTGRQGNSSYLSGPSFIWPIYQGFSSISMSASLVSKLWM